MPQPPGEAEGKGDKAGGPHPDLLPCPSSPPHHHCRGPMSAPISSSSSSSSFSWKGFTGHFTLTMGSTWS